MTVTQRISDESLFRGSIKKRHNNIRLKNKNKKKQEENKQGTKSSTDDEASSTTRYETAHIPWPHRATERNTEHLIVIGSWLLDFFFSFHVCIQKCLFHRRGRPRSFKSIRKQFFFSYSFCENPNTPRAPHENLDHWKTMERGFLFFLVQESKPSFQ